jgi:hypothetical protein
MLFIISSFQRTIFEKITDLSKLNRLPTLTSSRKINTNIGLFLYKWATIYFYSCNFLLRKEVIHPHVPVGIPCYDLTPIISPTLDVFLLAVRITASSITNSHGLTGGVYKPRERIHRDIADSRLLAIPAS